MGLLENDNVIFYHPLDNHIDNIPGEAWSGLIQFTSGQIVSGITPSINFSSGNLYTISDTSGVDYTWITADKGIVAIDDTHMLYAWHDRIAGVSNHVRARLVEINGNVITSGNLITLGTSQRQYYINWKPSIAYLGSGNIIISYHDSDYNLQFCRLFASGNTLIKKNSHSPCVGVYPSVCQLSPTKAIAFYRRNLYNHHARILQLSGDDDIISGDEYTFIEDANGEELVYSIDRLFEDKVIIGYCTPLIDPTQASGLIAEISGMTINFGSHYQITNSGYFLHDYGACFCIHALSNSKLIAAYNKPGESEYQGYMCSKIINISGTTLNVGDEQEWPGLRTDDFWMSIVPISDSRVIVSHYINWVGQPVWAGIAIHHCIVDGDKLLFGSGYANYSVTYDLPGWGIGKVSDNKIILGIWATGTDIKRNYIINMLPSSVISTSVPENYSSISGVQHFACAFWSKCPTSGNSITTIQDGYGIKLTSNSISLMPSGAVWDDADIISYLSGVNNGESHLNVIDLVYSGSNLWILKTSFDGSGWVNHGLPNSGIQPIINDSGIPTINFYNHDNCDSWLDELVFWAGNFNITNQKLINLYNLGSVYQLSMDKYGDYYDVSINENLSTIITGHQQMATFWHPQNWSNRVR